MIDQTLIRLLKTSGGLTHGSNVMGNQRRLWTISAPVILECNNAIQDLNELSKEKTIFVTGHSKTKKTNIHYPIVYFSHTKFKRKQEEFFLMGCNKQLIQLI